MLRKRNCLVFPQNQRLGFLTNAYLVYYILEVKIDSSRISTRSTIFLARRIYILSLYYNIMATVFFSQTRLLRAVRRNIF